MAARLWRLLVGCELAAAAMLWILVSLWFPMSSGAACAVAFGAAVGAPAAVLLLSFVVAALFAGRRLTVADLGYWLRALIGEAIDFNLAVLKMMGQCRIDMARTLEGPDSPSAASQPAQGDAKLASRGDSPSIGVRPLLLIHGIACNRGVWTRWRRWLRAAGFGPIRAVDLEPVFADIDAHAERVAGELRVMQQHAGGARVAIVAHSMGGLVARAALRLVGPRVVSRIVTVASPHHGTRIASLFRRVAPLRQMRIDSDWLRSLNAAQEGTLEAILTSIYSLEDNLVIPAGSASLRGARRIELRGIGHLGLLGSSKVRDHALTALSDA